ncbi:MAG: hypothetical protein OXL37_03625 [Chloroflexota bacterium]|nr:hypothetical protein [Chloroflexota bacterium]MDE2958593.1 hypothetical protein [Chloroflexota bacterium]
MYWHEPEDLGPEQDVRDAQLGRRDFYVYVLETTHGHYVGHTGRLVPRVGEHERGEVMTTAGTNPRLVGYAWFPTRQRAAEFEAQMKTCRDNRVSGFQQWCGREPMPWVWNSGTAEEDPTWGEPVSDWRETNRAWVQSEEYQEWSAAREQRTAGENRDLLERAVDGCLIGMAHILVFVLIGLVSVLFGLLYVSGFLIQRSLMLVQWALHRLISVRPGSRRGSETGS